MAAHLREIQMIIETTDNRKYRAEQSFISHLFRGTPVKLVKGEWVEKANARETFINKAHVLRIVEA